MSVPFRTESGLLIRDVKMRPVLRQWVRMMVEPWDGDQDAPWWYNERASLSQFAGAIWRERGWVFEEYAASKKVEGEVDRQKGRVDMMFEWGTIKIVAEAKQIWPSLETRKGFVKHVNRCLEAARADAMRAPDVAGRYRRLGLAFVVPVVPPRMVKKPDEYTAALRAFIAELKASKDATVAWAFPADRRTLRSKTKKYVYPGIALVIGHAL